MIGFNIYRNYLMHFVGKHWDEGGVVGSFINFPPHISFEIFFHILYIHLKLRIFLFNDILLLYFSSINTKNAAASNVPTRNTTAHCKSMNVSR